MIHKEKKPKKNETAKHHQQLTATQLTSCERRARFYF